MYGEKKGGITYLIQVIGKRDRWVLLFACAELKGTFGLLHFFISCCLKNTCSKEVQLQNQSLLGLDTSNIQSRGLSGEHRASCEDPEWEECVDPVHLQCGSLESVHFIDNGVFKPPLRDAVSCHHHQGFSASPKVVNYLKEAGNCFMWCYCLRWCKFFHALKCKGVKKYAEEEWNFLVCYAGCCRGDLHLQLCKVFVTPCMYSLRC